MFLVIAMLTLISLAFAQKQKPAKYNSFGFKHWYTKQEVVDASLGKNNLVRFPDVWKQQLVNVFAEQNQNLGGSRGIPPVEQIPEILKNCHVRLIPKNNSKIKTGYIDNDGVTGYWERPVLEDEYGLYYEDTVNGKKTSFLLMSLYCTNPVYQTAVVEDVSVSLSKLTQQPAVMGFNDPYARSMPPPALDSDGDGISDPFDTAPASGYQNSPASKSSVVRMESLPEPAYTSILYTNVRSTKKTGFKKNLPYYVGSAILVGVAAYTISASQSRNQTPLPRGPAGPTGPTGDTGNGNTGNPNGDTGNGNPDPGPTGPVGDDGHGGRPSGYNPPRVFMIGFSTSF